MACGAELPLPELLLPLLLALLLPVCPELADGGLGTPASCVLPACALTAPLPAVTATGAPALPLLLEELAPPGGAAVLAPTWLPTPLLAVLLDPGGRELPLP